MSVQKLIHLTGESLRDPRAFAERLKAAKIPRINCWEILAVAAILGVFMNHVNISLMLDLDAVPVDMLDKMRLDNARKLVELPYIHAIIYMSVLVISVFVLFWVSRMAGGTGGFAPGILVMAWITYLSVVLGVFQLGLWLVSPALSTMFGVAVTALTLWVLTNLIAGVHGFTSPFKVFVMMIATSLAVLFGLAFFFGLLGLTLPGVPV